MTPTRRFSSLPIVAQAAWIAVLLGGCGGAAQVAGYFLEPEFEAGARELGRDAARRLTNSYGPDCSWHLQHPAGDAFGEALTRTLRSGGDRVLEPDASDATALPLAYTVDPLKGTQMVRVLVDVAAMQMTRVYSFRSGRPSPAGPWMIRQEGQ